MQINDLKVNCVKQTFEKTKSYILLIFKNEDDEKDFLKLFRNQNSKSRRRRKIKR